MQVSSTSASRSAQSVPACGQAMRMADWGSHSAGKRSLESDMETFCMHSCTQRCRQGTGWIRLSGWRAWDRPRSGRPCRSEEHTSELQSLMRISYAVFCLKKKQKYQLCEDNCDPSHTNTHHRHTQAHYL